MTYILSFIVAFGVTFIAGQMLDPPAAQAGRRGRAIREDGPTWHMSKQGTPTMGGLMFILGIGVAIVTAGWEEIQRGNFIYLFVYLFALVFGAIGFVDDFQKLRHHAERGADRPAEISAPAGGGGGVHRAAAQLRISDPESVHPLFQCGAGHALGGLYGLRRLCHGGLPSTQ